MQAMQDIYVGRGLCLIDPHGDLVTRVKSNIPKGREKDLIYFDLTDPGLSLKYNPLRKVSPGKRSLVASGILEVLKKLWHSAWGVKLEHILRYCLLTLLDQPQASISDINRLLLDRQFRLMALQHVKDNEVLSFWKKEYPRYMRFDVLPVLNKVGGILAHPVIKQVLIENKEEVSLRKAMDDKKIVLVNLSKGHIGEDAAQILGALLLTSLGSAAFSRVDIDEGERVPFIIYMDEFQSFTTLSLINLCSELRKFKVGLVLAHQYMAQLDPEVRSAIFGNIGTILSFRLGPDDANHMAREMYPKFDLEDFINMANYHIYLKLMIDGRPSKPFSAKTLRYQTHGSVLKLVG